MWSTQLFRFFTEKAKPKSKKKEEPSSLFQRHRVDTLLLDLRSKFPPTFYQVQLHSYSYTVSLAHFKQRSYNNAVKNWIVYFYTEPSNVDIMHGHYESVYTLQLLMFNLFCNWISTMLFFFLQFQPKPGEKPIPGMIFKYIIFWSWCCIINSWKGCKWDYIYSWYWWVNL